jgi:hypothetical protein
MGQAKNRGNQAARQAEAIEAGRIKIPTTQSFHENPGFTIPGYEPTLVQKLQDRIRSDIPASEKFHILTKDLENPPESDLLLNPYGQRWPS